MYLILCQWSYIRNESNLNILLTNIQGIVQQNKKKRQQSVNKGCEDKKKQSLIQKTGKIWSKRFQIINKSLFFFLLHITHWKWYTLQIFLEYVWRHISYTGSKVWTNTVCILSEEAVLASFLSSLELMYSSFWSDVYQFNWIYRRK